MSNYDFLNNEQQKAVLCTEGPVLILAGAGSGKTRVLTNRIAYLIDEKNVDPYNILAVTFTNKAAGEMRNRVMKACKESARGIWVATFHSTCVRILRRHIDALGYDSNYAIYDSDDQKSLIKQIIKKLDIDSKVFKEKMFMSRISGAKEKMMSPEAFEAEAGSDYGLMQVAKVYRAYQKELKANNALDFDDLLLKTVELFESRPDILDMYQERFKYIMIDEYQDTNTVQFRLVQLLARKYRNLCVVGDDDQSIYRFRGANIRNILDFEQEYPDAMVIRLEQNYRSTDMILGAANEVIRHNKGRKSKTLWTENGEGSPVRFNQFGSGYEEAEFVAGDIGRKVRRDGRAYSEFAVLYRTNAQSRLFEEKFIGGNIPYKLVGGVNFYARKEIKDLLSYMKIPVNTSDSLALLRIINVPKRGIGPTSVSRIEDYADSKGISFFDALMEVDIIPDLSRGRAQIREFADLIRDLCKDGMNCTPSEFLQRIINKTGYVAELELENTDEARARIENIDELMSKVVSYEEEHGDESNLRDFLEEVSLVADIDSLEDEKDYVVLMTLHSAKGLEFPDVYIVGMEEGLFPGYMAINSNDPMDIEEERRLCYVGITRAMKNLSISCAKSRMINGNTQYNPVSRFVKEIPDKYLDAEKKLSAANEIPRNDAYRKSVEAFRAKPFMSQSSSSDRSSVKMGQEWGSASAYRSERGSASAYGSERGSASAYGGKDSGFGFSKGSELSASKSGAPDYAVGDRVRHIKFGQGTVTAIRDAGRDYEVTVEFDSAGTKKMFAAFAKLKKTD